MSTEFLNLAENLNSLPVEIRAQIPEIFFEQARNNYPKAHVSGKMLEDRAFSILLADPKKDPENEECVTCILRLQGIMDDNGILLPQSSAQGERTLPAGFDWIKGCRSVPLRITPQMVTAAEMVKLREYAETFERVGPDIFYEAGGSVDKIYLRSSSAGQLAMQFFFEVRTTPGTNEQVAGLCRLAVQNIALLGKGISPMTVEDNGHVAAIPQVALNGNFVAKREVAAPVPAHSEEVQEIGTAAVGRPSASSVGRTTTQTTPAPALSRRGTPAATRQ